MQHYGAPTRLTDWTLSPFVACYFAYAEQTGEDAAVWMLDSNCFASMNRNTFDFAISCPLFERDHLGSKAWRTYADGKLISEEFPGRDLRDEQVFLTMCEILQEAMSKQDNRLMLFPILSPDPRMLAQQGCFICSGKLAPYGNNGAIQGLLEQVKATYEKLTVRVGEYLSYDECRQISSAGFGHIRKVRLPAAWRSHALRSLSQMNITADTMFPGLDGIGKSSQLYLQVLENEFPISRGIFEL